MQLEFHLSGADPAKSARLKIDGPCLLIEFLPATDSVTDRQQAAMRRDKFHLAISFFLSPYLENDIEYDPALTIDPFSVVQNGGVCIFLKFKKEVDIDIIKLLFNGEHVPSSILYQLLPAEALVDAEQALASDQFATLHERIQWYLDHPIEEQHEEMCSPALSSSMMEPFKKLKQSLDYYEQSLEHQQTQEAMLEKSILDHLQKFDQSKLILDDIKQPIQQDIKYDQVDLSMEAWTEKIKLFDNTTQKIQAILSEEMALLTQPPNIQEADNTQKIEGNAFLNEVKRKKIYQEKILRLLEKNMRQPQPVLFFSDMHSQWRVSMRHGHHRLIDKDIFLSEIIEGKKLFALQKAYVERLNEKTLEKDALFRSAFSMEPMHDTTLHATEPGAMHFYKRNLQHHFTNACQTVTSYAYSAYSFVSHQWYKNKVRHIKLKDAPEGTMMNKP